jgi:hypothetical protein
MKFFRSPSVPICLAVLLASTAAQVPVTQTAVFPSPGSQLNSPGASLHVTAVVQSPGEAPSPLVTVLSPGSLSSTLAYVSFGSTTFPAPGSMTLSGSLNGTSGAPFTLGLSIVPGSTFCGGFAGWPCMTGPLLFNTIPTPFGLYHLTTSPIIVLDGIGGSAPPGFLDGNGTFPLSATGVVNTVTNGGFEFNLAVQAAVLDPSALSGLTLSACLTVNQWVFYL